MRELLRKVRWTDILNLGLSFALPWFFYALLQPSTPDYTLAFLSGLSFWSFMTWIYDLRRYGLERNLGWFGWTLSILGGFAAYGCMLGGMVFMLVDVPKVDPARVVPFVTIALGCLAY
ncbi:MAG: hypothetical protein L0312_26280, partial [Acidobacteria bacterium]|nr:hypothetical protein [Acidobacteriota bacterium]